MFWLIALVASFALGVGGIVGALRHPEQAMRALARRERRENPKGWWRLTFIEPGDPKKRRPERALGSAVVEGHGVVSASLRARRLGVNPGGIVHGEQLNAAPPEPDRNRLIAPPAQP